MTGFLTFVYEEYPLIAACGVMAAFVWLFWFLLIYDFPERMIRWILRRKGGSGDNNDGYNIFD